jgi:ABC-type multidrug transport system ATPase subunit
MLEIRGLGRSYGPVRALDGVGLTVRSGEIVGLLGANGAGKSTLMRTVAGLQLPDQGAVTVAGVSLDREPIEARRHLGYAAEEPTFYEDLSAAEFLAFLSALHGLDPGEARSRAGALLERLGLASRAEEPVRQYSHGMRKKLSFTAAVLHRPAVLLCDEALEGFDVAAALEAKTELRARAGAGAAVLFSSHVTESVERLCDRVVVLHRGRIARTLERREWGSPDAGPSRLEREFLGVMQGGAEARAS